MTFVAGEIIGYQQMCLYEGVSLQRGMNFRVTKGHSVVLMSVRTGAPYHDQVLDEGRTLIYEGHNVPKSAEHPLPDTIDQASRTPIGSLTQNGRFFAAAEGFKHGEHAAELVRVYDKLRSGIWAFVGTFNLVDAWQEQSAGRQVYKFKLTLNETLGGIAADVTPDTGSIQLSHTRVIPSAVKQAVFKRDKGKCVFCGATDNLHFDHILPFSKGGTSATESNIQLLCARHNLEKSDSI